MFTNLSHEFRTPLSLIISPLQMLLSQNKFDEGNSKLLNIIDRNSHILLRLVNQIMDFSKNNKGTLNINLGHYDIVNFSKKIIEQFTIIAEEKNIELQFLCSYKSFYIFFDKDQMEEIMYNLLSNAIKYTPNDGTVSLELDVEDSYFKMRFSDTGYGISKEDSEHIFDRFYTACDNYGVGIGLPLTKALVLAHQGKIEFTSNLGKGSCFIVSLPINIKNKYVNCTNQVDNIYKDNSITDSDNLLQSESESIDSEYRKRYITIMIVDDNNQMLDFLTTLFSPLYRIVTANNGMEALEKCHKTLPNIVISDIMMPIMDGIKLCIQLKNNKLTSHIPVILLTAKVTKQTHEEGLEASADAYITKPYDNNILLSTVKSLLINRSKLIQKYKDAFSNDVEESTNNDLDKVFIKKLVGIVENNLSNLKLNVEFVCNEIGINQVNLNKKLKELTGQTTNEFIRDIKLKHAAKMLTTNKYTIAEITYALGFNDLRYFRDSFHKKFGVLPSEYRRNIAK